MRTNATHAAQAENQLAADVRRLAARAVRFRLWLLALFAAAIAIAVVATMLQPPLYRSTARIEISRVDAGASQALDPRGSGVERRDMQYYTTQYYMLGSRAVAERVVDALDLTRDAEFADAYGTNVGMPREAAIAWLRQGLGFEPILNSSLVDISFTSPGAELSARVINTWAEEFLALNYERRFGDTILARDQLSEQLAEMRVQLEESEARLASYANANEIIVLNSTSETGDTTRSTILANELQAMNAALADAAIRRINAQTRLQSDNVARGAQRSTILQRISDARAELANLRTTLGPGHPDVRAQEAELASLTGSLQNDGADAIRENRAAYEQAATEERELRQRYEATRARYMGQQGRGVAFGILEREVETNRRIYDALLQRYNQLGIVGTGSNNMAIVESARPAQAPLRSSLPGNIVIALLLATMLAGGFIYVGDRFDQTLREPDDVPRQLGLPLLGLIPHANEDDIKEQLSDEKSFLSEAYASARVSLQALPEHGQLRTIMITSTRPAEGKSVSSIAVAKSFADVGRTVVLVDLDLRKRGASRFLQMPRSEIDIVRYLASGSTTPTPRRMDDYGFDFIGSNRSPASPVTLLASPKLPALLRDLEARYDTVIVDGPPVLGLADAVELTRMVDGVVYVIEANSGPIRSIRRALSRLRGASANILGGFLTKLDERNSGYGYGYSYGYGYGHADETSED